VLKGCRYHCDPAARSTCEDCARLKSGGKLKTEELPVPVVDLPLGASEDRVLGALDLERALSQGIKALRAGSARARIAAFSTSTRSIGWRTIWLIC